MEMRVKKTQEQLWEERQQRLKSFYEEQNSRQGKVKNDNRNDFIKKANEKLGLHIPTKNINVLVNLQTGEIEQYFYDDIK